MLAGWKTFLDYSLRLVWGASEIGSTTLYSTNKSPWRLRFSNSGMPIPALHRRMPITYEEGLCIRIHPPRMFPDRSSEMQTLHLFIAGTKMAHPAVWLSKAIRFLERSAVQRDACRWGSESQTNIVMQDAHPYWFCQCSHRLLHSLWLPCRC